MAATEKKLVDQLDDELVANLHKLEQKIRGLLAEIKYKQETLQIAPSDYNRTYSARLAVLQSELDRALKNIHNLMDGVIVNMRQFNQYKKSDDKPLERFAKAVAKYTKEMTKMAQKF